MPEQPELIVEELEFPLTKSFKYTAANGTLSEAENITLYAPTGKDAAACSTLRQGFLRAMKESMQDSDLTDAVAEAKEAMDALEEQKLLGEVDADEDVVALPSPLEGGSLFLSGIAMATTVDYAEFLATFRKLLLGGRIAKIDGHTKLLPLHLDNMDYKDLQDLCGVYVRNFIEG